MLSSWHDFIRLMHTHHDFYYQINFLTSYFPFQVYLVYLEHPLNLVPIIFISKSFLTVKAQLAIFSLSFTNHWKANLALQLI